MTKDLMFNFNTRYGLTDGGNESPTAAVLDGNSKIV